MTYSYHALLECVRLWVQSFVGSNQTIKIKIVNAKHAAIKKKNKDRLSFRVRMMCLSEMTCLSLNCCFSELTLYKSDSSCWSYSKLYKKSSLSHQNVNCSCHNIGNNCSFGMKQTITHSLFTFKFSVTFDN